MAIDDYFNNNDGEEREEPYPDFFTQWDNAVSQNKSPGYYDADDLCEIIDIYFSEGDADQGKFAINYALKLYPDNEDLIYEIMLMLNEYGYWDDLLEFCEKYKNITEVWPDGHKISALLHLGMEEHAFIFFKTIKNKYVNQKENLIILYQAMSEALYEVDLFDAAIDVINEALPLLGNDPDLLWIQLQSYLSNKDNENVIAVAQVIQMLKPLDSETWNRLGNIYKQIDDIEKSIEAFEFAQSLGLRDAEVYMNLIYAYEKNGNLNKVIEKANEYLALIPNSYIVNLMAANACSKKNDWVNSLKYIQNALDLEPEMDSLYLYKSEFLIRLDEYQKAILTLEEGIKKTGDTQGKLQAQLVHLRDMFPES